MDEAFQFPWLNDPRSTAELLALARHEWLNDDESEGAWETMCILQKRATPEVFQAAEQWCRSGDAMDRRLAAVILRRIGGQTDAFHAEAVALLLPLLSDPDPSVIAGAAYAFGQRHDQRAIPPLLSLMAHPDEKVRLGVVSGLSCLNDGRAIAGLIELTRDPDAAVRDWATFGLGSQTEVDTPALREALLARTMDEDAAARGEALVGLALRHDLRVVEPLLRELTGEYHGIYAAEAVEAFPSPIFYEALQALRASIAEHNPWFLRTYEEVLAACRPIKE